MPFGLHLLAESVLMNQTRPMYIHLSMQTVQAYLVLPIVLHGNWNILAMVCMLTYHSNSSTLCYNLWFILESAN